MSSFPLGKVFFYVVTAQCSSWRQLCTKLLLENAVIFVQAAFEELLCGNKAALGSKDVMGTSDLCSSRRGAASPGASAATSPSVELCLGQESLEVILWNVNSASYMNKIDWVEHLMCLWDTFLSPGGA